MLAYHFMLYAGFFVLIAVSYRITDPAFLADFLRLACAYILVGAGAYLLNDYSDLVPDSASGKWNAVQHTGKTVALILITILWSAGALIVYTLPGDLLLLLGGQLLLLLLYSVKPFRLKERRITGVVADALYAHVVPELMLLVLAGEYAGIPWSFAGCLLGFTFLTGLRDILVHQLNDAENDRFSGTKTLAVQKPGTARMIARYAEPCSMIAAGGMLLAVSLQTGNRLLLVSMLLMAGLYLHAVNQSRGQVPAGDASTRAYVLAVYPLLLVIAMLNRPGLHLVFLLHPYAVSVMRQWLNKLYIVLKMLVKVLFALVFIRLLPAIVNRVLYVLFLLFGRDLKERPLYERENEPLLFKRIRKLIG